jgi:hypothetical protein
MELATSMEVQQILHLNYATANLVTTRFIINI